MAHDLKISANAKSFNIEGGSKLEVLDENNNLLYQGEFKSFTSNFLKLLYGSMVGAGKAKAKDLTNTNVEMNAFPALLMNLYGGSGIKKFGLVVGTSDTIISVSDYNISIPYGLTLGATAIGASSVGADFVSVEISRQISNTTGASVVLKEAGLICGLGSENDNNVLIARDLLSVTLDDGKKSTWRYIIKFNFENDKGGFLQSFADKMFKGIFSNVTSSAGWSKRYSFGCCVYDNKIWVMGGYTVNDNKDNDVWCSTDGINWTQATSAAVWRPRVTFGCCVFDNKMWVMGGQDDFGYNRNDVWCSTNGINWTLAASAAGWSSRFGFGCCIFDNKIWVMGGYTGSYMRDVWYSTDGVNWIQATSSAGWGARNGFGCCIFDNKIWVMGGQDSGGKKGDVWYSTDGVNWTQATSAAGWSARSEFGCCVYDNKIWVMGGQDSGGLKNDVWYSTDGINWTQAASAAGWGGRTKFSSCVYDNKMWVMGGAWWYNDVWKSKFLTSEIKVGSSDTPFSATATALGAEIAGGSGSGQLIYGVMPAPETTEPSTSGNKTSFSLAREFTNSSGADITIKEVGLFSGSDMLARLILENPITLADGESEIVTIDFETEV